MFSAEENDILTEVGPDTLMGDLLRRYWTPACLTAELPEPGGAPVRVQLFGENLVAFRDTRGRVGLVQEHCPHRGASLFFGRNEDAALRCVYHGWAFDVNGRCVDVPSEPAPFCATVRMRAYPVHESGGIGWAYLGPRDSMTPFRDFGTEGLAAFEFTATKQLIACNWVQAMESNLDPAHISHLHRLDTIDSLPDDGSDKPGYPSNVMSWRFSLHDRRPRLELQDTWYGYRYAGVRTTPNGYTHVQVTAYAVPYSTMVAKIPFSVGHTMFVPADDGHCWRYSVAPRQPLNPRGLGGASVLTGAMEQRSQLFMVTESLGPNYDRTQEQLGSTDRAITRMRRILIAAARGLASGDEPPAVGGDLDYESIRGAEKILEPGEDWRVLGTDDDPVVREAYCMD